jgi:hypothetical protein
MPHLVLCQAQLTEASTQLLQVGLALLHVSSPGRLQRSQLRDIWLLLPLLPCCNCRPIAHR